jgi:hypothetical protein
MIYPGWLADDIHARKAVSLPEPSSLPAALEVVREGLAQLAGK